MSLLAPLTLTLSSLGLAGSSPSEDGKAARAAAEDYVRALYDVEPARIERSVHPELVKYGFWRPDADTPYKGGAMSYEQLVALAGKWNAGGDRADENSPAEVELLALMPDIACVKLTAQWGIDYMNVVKEDGRWKILQVMWQAPMEEGSKAAAADDEALLEPGRNYVAAFYQTKPELLDRSIHPSLNKFGWWQQPGAAAAVPTKMDFASLKGLAAQLHAQQKPADDAPKVVEVLDAMNHTAVLRIVGHWGVDYAHVDKEAGHWQVRHVLWQSHPRGARAPESELAQARNETCPFSGQPIRADSLSTYRGKVLGFCNPECAAKFAQLPEAFVHELKGWIGD